MTLMQIILLAVTAFLAYKVYEHMQGLQDSNVIGEPTAEQIDIDALVEEADKAYDAGRLLEARELLQKAYNHDSTIPELANRLGFVTSAMGNHDDALKLYIYSLGLKEEDVTHLAIASELRQLGRFEESQQHYEKAIELDDSYEVTYFNYANLLAEMGETDRAKAMYEKALAIAPDLEPAKEELEKLNAR